MMTFIQKTKRFLPSKNLIPIYSLLINILGSYFFCMIFTKNINILESIWIGLFSFLGADTLYSSLEGKLSSYSDLNNEIKGVITYEE